MIGAVTITYNDGYKVKEWRQNYNAIEPIIDYYVIVDNGSSDEYKQQLKELFPNAVYIWSDKNLGCTGAYNLGIKYLLNNTDAEYIMLFGNDIKIYSEDLEKLIMFLDKNRDVGIITSTLLEKDSSIVADAGCYINRKDLSLVAMDVGKEYDEIEHTPIEVEAVTGGFNIATSNFYKIVGLQDDVLFMYSDEVDTGIRAKKCGFKMVMLRDTVAWHQHINPQGTATRHPYSAYLMARNKIYLSYKHNGFLSAWLLFLKYSYNDLPRIVFNRIKKQTNKVEWFRWHLIGAGHGLIKDMRPNQYSSL